VNSVPSDPGVAEWQLAREGVQRCVECFLEIKADYSLKIAEFKTDDANNAGADSARKAYYDASTAAFWGLPFAMASFISAP